MSEAICFKCGALKRSAFVTCTNCQAHPASETEEVLSVVLSDQCLGAIDLAACAEDIRCKRRLVLDPRKIEQAKAAMKDPQFRASLSVQEDANKTPRRPQGQPSVPITTALHRNPFGLLGATTRDDRHRIVALAEEKSLVLDSDTCEKARAHLTNLRSRISAEVAWLPGLSPERTRELLDTLPDSVDSLKSKNSLPPLAKANLLAAAFERFGPEMESSSWRAWIMMLADTVAAIDPEDVLRAINEDREVAGFPTVKSRDVIEAELSERMRCYKDAVKSALNELPSQKLVDVVTLVADTATAAGTKHAPLLVDELIDGYQADTLSYLTKEAQNIAELLERVKVAASRADGSISKVIDGLDGMLRKWNWVAHPIQLSMKARGRDHDQSLALAYQIRSLAVDIFNKHNDNVSAGRLTKTLGELFAHLPEFANRVQQDARTLAEISEGQTKQAAALQSAPARRGDSAGAVSSSRQWKFWGWATGIVVVGLWLASQAPSTPTQDARTESSEQRPAIGDGLVLSAAEIRYCLAEDIRVNGMKKAVNQYSASSVDAFNRAVSDYNSRCSHFRYRSGALEAARREVESRRAALELDGMQRIAAHN